MTLRTDLDLIDAAWPGRPGLPQPPVYEHRAPHAVTARAIAASLSGASHSPALLLLPAAPSSPRRAAATTKGESVFVAIVCMLKPQWTW